MRKEIWLHIPTFTLALVDGQYGEFKWNGKMEESHWMIFRKEPLKFHGWKKVCDL